MFKSTNSSKFILQNVNNDIKLRCNNLAAEGNCFSVFRLKVKQRFTYKFYLNYSEIFSSSFSRKYATNDYHYVKKRNKELHHIERICSYNQRILKWVPIKENILPRNQNKTFFQTSESIQYCSNEASTQRSLSIQFSNMVWQSSCQRMKKSKSFWRMFLEKLKVSWF